MLEGLIDRYRAKTDRRSGIVQDPNDPESIVRLVKKAVTASVETVRIVSGLPPRSIPREGEEVKEPAA